MLNAYHDGGAEQHNPDLDVNLPREEGLTTIPTLESDPIPGATPIRSDLTRLVAFMAVLALAGVALIFGHPTIASSIGVIPFLAWLTRLYSIWDARGRDGA
ncbi:hypothetical protein [Nocardia sp. CDC160]|uniref:hypothetical protein n=1 Tax=Nocardia sp. CDC160 TaxID=3112166 RepID=UPI002DBCC7E8|nr:hypothetical protein [Nocardia sp. CDC160]MEC3915976.1 hypothetical protein [Nocardia sp. CDC160]